MNIAFIANPESIHDCKWINKISNLHKAIIICSNQYSPSPYLKEGIHVHSILPPFPHRNIFKRDKVLTLLKAIIKENKIDIIHTMYAYPNAFWINLLGFKNHIITTRGSDILVDYKSLFKANLSFNEKKTAHFFISHFNESFKNAKVITSTSASQQEIIKRFVKNHQKLKLIRTGIDVDDFLQISNNIKKNNSDLIIFSPRSMMPIYNIDIILKSFALVLQKRPKIKLILINDNPNTQYSKSILKLISTLKLETNCIVTNKLSKKEMSEWYTKSDLVVSIPKTDGSPNSVLEAMLLKKMVIMGTYQYDADLFSLLPKLDDCTPEDLSHKIITELDNSNSIAREEILEKNYNLVLTHANLKKSIYDIDKIYKSVTSPYPQKKDKKINTLFIAAWYPHRKNKTNGNFIKEHAKAVSLFANVSVVFIDFNKTNGIPSINNDTKFNKNLSEYFVSINSPIRRFDIHDKLIKKAYKKVINLIKSEEDIDICHINVRDIYTKSVLELPEISFPIVITEHFSHYHTGIHQLQKKEKTIETNAIKQWFNDSRIKYVMPVSKQLGNVFINDFDVPKDKIIDIPNVADKCFYYSPKLKHNNIKIVLVANWHKPKNPLLFLKALKLINNDVLANIEIDWIGDGTQMKGIKTYIQKNLPNLSVKFWGTKEKSFIAEKFRNANFFVHPTDAENLPTVIIESLCCGTPILTHNVNGIPELVNSSNGIMSKPKDVEEFANNFLKMLNIHTSFNNLKIAQNAQKKFYIDPISQQLKEVYLKALDKNV